MTQSRDKSLNAYMLSHVQLFVTPWTVTRQAPLSMGLSMQEYWVGCYALLQGIFLTQGLNLRFLNWQADSLPLSHLGSPPIRLLLLLLSHFSCVWLSGTLGTIARQAPLSMGFFRQEYWSRLPFPSPGDVPPGIEIMSLALQMILCCWVIGETPLISKDS